MSERYETLMELIRENKQLKEYNALLEQRLADAGQEVLVMRTELEKRNGTSSQQQSQHTS